MAEQSARSWFCVLNNPEWHNFYKHDSNGDIIYDNDHVPIIDHQEPSIFNGLSPEEICDKVNEEWCKVSESRTCACAYCISAKGLHHLHFVPCDAQNFRFGQIKTVFPSAHIEITKGTKRQAENYLQKKGIYEEKGEVVVCIRYHGEICSNQGHRSDLDEIQTMIDDGYSPDQITSKGIRFLSKEKLIKAAFYKKRIKETPILRDVKVFFHYGRSGCGKSFSYIKLCKEKGESEVFFVGNYDNGFLDEYNGQKVLFLDEFRGQIRYATLLSICQGYRQYYHARNHNILGLWDEVHITSVLPPELLYQKNLTGDQHDVIGQFMRRLTGVYYHFKDGDKFETRFIPMEEYSGFQSCFKFDDGGFAEVPKYEQITLPF